MEVSNDCSRRIASNLLLYTLDEAVEDGFAVRHLANRALHQIETPQVWLYVVGGDSTGCCCILFPSLLVTSWPAKRLEWVDAFV